MASVHRITPCLWFDDQAEQADRVMTALLEMKKLDIAALERAAVISPSS